jgi:hypothetical protein
MADTTPNKNNNNIGSSEACNTASNTNNNTVTAAAAASSEYTFVTEASIERHMKRQARKLFLLERADVLLQLPSSYKRSFGRIVFLINNNNPALIVGPYHVPPGPLRLLWMNEFLQVRSCFVIINVHFCVPLIAPLYQAFLE